MKLSAFAFVQHAEELDYPVDLWLKWHCALFDEVSLVTVEETTLGTHRIQPKIMTGTVSSTAAADVNAWLKPFHVYRRDDGTGAWHIELLQLARSWCSTGDWHVKLDVDEFVHEDDIAPMRAFLSSSKAKQDRIYQTSHTHFWGSLKNEIRGWARPGMQRIIHASAPMLFNLPETGDISGTVDPRWKLDVFHTGAARHPVKMNKKFASQHQRYFGPMGGDPELVAEGLAQTVPHDYSVIPKGGRIVPYDGRLPRVLVENAERFNWWWDPGGM